MSSEIAKETETKKAQGSLFFSFGFKLMLIMTVLVAAVSVAAVLVVQMQLTHSYRDFLDSQFSQEVNDFRYLQAERAKNIRDEIITAAGAVRPLAAITQSKDPQHIYTDLEYELEPSMNFYQPKHGAAPVFFRYFNVDGQLVSDPNRKDHKHAIDSTKFEPLVKMATKDASGVFGYIVIETENKPVLYEVTITEIHDDYTGDKIGYILFGIPAELDDRGAQKNRSIRSLMYVDGYFFPQTLSQESREQLKPFIDKAQAAGSSSQELTLNKQSYLLFTRDISKGGNFPETLQLSLYSLEELESLLENLNVLMYALLPVSLVVAIVLSALASRRIAQRVLTLAKGTEAIRQGDLEVRMEPMGRDEIGVLADSFNRMAEDLELKEKYRSVLDLVTEKSVAEELLTGAIELGGELRQATMLFCDIRGFTPLTDGMDPREVVSLVNGHMTEMTRIAHACNGVVDKFVGDEIMVLFGVPHAGEDDVANAVRCGLNMIAERNRLNENMERPINIGIGIATGKVVAGCMGSEKRLNYSVLGDRVNLAARLCSKAAAGEVIIDEETVNALPEGSKSTRIDSVALKGFANQVSVYRIESIP
ncbi:adenylate/guanylate cyclase domain-containing protein [Rubellicoccus peritrichatus]|uniref:Adenylate/guanylate cyclase domain-containing protein n=1 Tax=Rubellicoccus peritrichatus TaxID=3080537 RepID=A0AAQ3LCV2_9BACT|nr:adenylate/guanylate cyclase domain-containing protein [Puniceicoccus sp. CR14]WOO43679.1 adenylate/guanylate cyclase domain-containing protein [Puniceicoccus sp. CR14]